MIQAVPYEFQSVPCALDCTILFWSVTCVPECNLCFIVYLVFHSVTCVS